MNATKLADIGTIPLYVCKSCGMTNIHQKAAEACCRCVACLEQKEECRGSFVRRCLACVEAGAEILFPIDGEIGLPSEPVSVCIPYFPGSLEDATYYESHQDAIKEGHAGAQALLTTFTPVSDLDPADLVEAVVDRVDELMETEDLDLNGLEDLEAALASLLLANKKTGAYTVNEPRQWFTLPKE